MASHTSKDFETELRTLRERLCAMGGRAEQQIELAMKSLVDSDAELARQVIENDKAVDRDENEIDELALQILATRQPVASDLRFIAMSLKLVTDLERIGDLASGIAKRALELAPLPHLTTRSSPAFLATLVLKNLRAAMDAFVAKDADSANAVIAADIEIDRVNATLFAELLGQLMSDAAAVQQVLPMTSVCRYLERIGDHVKNLAEGVVYMVHAQDIRHRPYVAPAN